MYLKTACGLIAMLVVSGVANASFYIDYQGLERPKVETKVRDVISPNGYRLLTDGLQGIVYEIGGRPGNNFQISNFADDIEFKYGVGAIIPDGWSAYVDEHIEDLGNVSFSAENEYWLEVLARVGTRYGYKFVVDWDNRMVQISLDEFYSEPDPNVPISVQDDSGQEYYIYKSKQSFNKGYVIVDGEIIPIKMKK